MQLTETQLNAEKTVLGNCIDGADKVAALIEQGFTKAHFVLLAHQKVWSAFETLAKTPEKVNITDLIQHLEAAGELESVGGHAGLVELSTSFAYHFQFEPSVKILVEAKKKRDVESLFISGLENLQNPTLTKDEVLAEAEKVMSSLRESYGVAQVARMADGTQKVVEGLEFRIKNPGQTKGLPTGYPSLDRMLDGLQNTAMVVIGARPAVGKTSFMTNILYNLAAEGVPVGMFSLEMSKEQLVTRLIASEGLVENQRLITGNLRESDWQRIAEAASALSRMDIRIDDNPLLTVADMNAKCRRLENLGLVVIDYLQLMTSAGGKGYSGENRQQAVSDISRMLKIMAKELQVPVLCLSQLSRANEKREDKRPMLSDLRESGAIEQDADIVMFLYRDDYYNSDAEKRNVAECIVAKNRHGETGKVELRWMPEYTAFGTLETRYDEDE